MQYTSANIKNYFRSPANIYEPFKKHATTSASESNIFLAIFSRFTLDYFEIWHDCRKTTTRNILVKYVKWVPRYGNGKKWRSDFL